MKYKKQKKQKDKMFDTYSQDYYQIRDPFFLQIPGIVIFLGNAMHLDLFVFL